MTDERDGRTNILPWIANKANSWSDLCKSRKICQTIVKEVQIDGAKPIATSSGTKLDKDKHGIKVDQKL